MVMCGATVVGFEDYGVVYRGKRGCGLLYCRRVGYGFVDIAGTPAIEVDGGVDGVTKVHRGEGLVTGEAEVENGKYD